jgi:hypothetical protein
MKTSSNQLFTHSTKLFSSQFFSFKMYNHVFTIRIIFGGYFIVFLHFIFRFCKIYLTDSSRWRKKKWKHIKTKYDEQILSLITIEICKFTLSFDLTKNLFQKKKITIFFSHSIWQSQRRRRESLVSSWVEVQRWWRRRKKHSRWASK